MGVRGTCTTRYRAIVISARCERDDDATLTMQPSLTSISVLASGWRGDFHRCWPGLLMSVVIAVAATFIAEHRGGPTLLYALLLGMALNTVAAEGRAKPGVDFASRRILRLGVALDRKSVV